MSTTDDKPTRGQRVLDAVGWRMPELLTAGVLLLLAAFTWPWLGWLALLPLAWIGVEPLYVKRSAATRAAQRHRITAAAAERD